MQAHNAQWPDRMNPTDALFWLMDKIPELRSTIGALLILERPPPLHHLRAEIERLSHHLPRMRQRVHEVPLNLAPPEWIEDRHFDLDYHLRPLEITAPATIENVLDVVSPFYAEAFDPDRPLWEAYVINGLAEGRCAFFVKMHHCLTDGVGGSALLDDLLGQQRERTTGETSHPTPPRETDLASVLWRATRYNVDESAQLAKTAVDTATDLARHPGGWITSLRRAFQAMSGFSRELTRPRARSPLHDQRSLSRRLSTFEMSLHEIDAVRERLGATNNDITLTIVAGAMHRWHTSRGADVRELRAMVPVSLRTTADALGGNRLALLAISLPIGQPNPLRRLRIIQERMGRVKTDRRATLYPLLARFMLAMPLLVTKELGRQQTQRTNFVCTNVPGPRQSCFLAGERIEQIYPYAPLLGDHPVAIALYSYRDRVYVGLDIDPMAMADLPHFHDALRESYEEILSVGRDNRIAPSLRRRSHAPRSSRKTA